MEVSERRDALFETPLDNACCVALIPRDESRSYRRDTPCPTNSVLKNGICGGWEGIPTGTLLVLEVYQQLLCGFCGYRVDEEFLYLQRQSFPKFMLAVN
ncbi:unnamed protein product [Litomosoides sigmodontis]|uniref:Uncharacterized protein n=1 Tax=Litomosoides sigmodontis TaxID=42156 RepID=A0A3P6TZA8_LITSI|nr:unnamed protein product [Litomosoides sigmodontis]